MLPASISRMIRIISPLPFAANLINVWGSGSETLLASVKLADSFASELFSEHALTSYSVGAKQRFISALASVCYTWNQDFKR